MICIHIDFRGFASAFSCLSDNPTTVPVESNIAALALPGQLFTPDDQCKMFYGPTWGWASVFYFKNQNLT